MGRRIDLTGQRFGRLTVVSLNEEISKQKKNSYWNCKCDCGNVTVVRGNHLKSGNTTSCGCYNREKSSDKMKRMNEEMWQDEEFRQMKSELSSKRLKEKWQDEEFRQMQSDKMREMWQDEEYRQMQTRRLEKLWQDEEFRQMKSEQRKRMNEEMWQDEEFRQMHKNIKHNYKGGITPISDYLRHLPLVQQWFDDSKKQANYTCELTEKVGGELNTHHLKAFSTIVLEAHELHNIQIHEIIGEYTKEELHKLEEYVAGWHEDTSNAVVLCKEAHKLFHSLYGKGGNTPEQFDEFKQRYMAGEFKDLI